MISSAMPSEKYSLSRSALMLTNGKTAIDFAAAATDRVPGGGDVAPDPSAWPNCAAVAYRSAGAFARALVTACSTHSGTASRKACSAGTRSVKAWAMIAGTGDFERLLQWQLPLALEALPQRLPLDERHHVVEEIVSLPRIVQRHDVGMLQPGRDLDLTKKTVGAETNGQLRVQHLDRHRAL